MTGGGCDPRGRCDPHADVVKMKMTPVRRSFLKRFTSKSFYTHHMRMISKQANMQTARSVRKEIMCRKQRLYTADAVAAVTPA